MLTVRGGDLGTKRGDRGIGRAGRVAKMGDIVAGEEGGERHLFGRVGRPQKKAKRFSREKEEKKGVRQKKKR